MAVRNLKRVPTVHQLKETSPKGVVVTCGATVNSREMWSAWHSDVTCPECRA